jgi:O-antigen/teichoic acid export membrane protein
LKTNDNAAGRVAKNTGILYIRMAITVFISLYATRLIVNALGVTDFGIFNVVAGAIAMLTFLNTAMAGATQRFISYAEGAGDFNKVKTVFNVSLVLHFIIALIIFITLEVVGYFLFDGVLKIPESRVYVAKVVYQFMIISTLIAIISVPYDAVINAHENMLLVAVISIIEAMSRLAIAIYLSHSGYDKLIVYGLLTASLSVLLLFFRWLYCRASYDECEIKIKKYYDKGSFKEMTVFASWSFLGSSSSMLANYGQSIVLNMFFGPVVNAAQGIAMQVSGQLSVFSDSMQRALKPVIDKSEGGGNRQLMLKASMTGNKLGFFLLIFFSIPVLIEMPYIFKLWLKTVPAFAVIFCSLQLIRNMIEQLFSTLNSVILAVGNIRKYQSFLFVLNFLPLIFSYILLKNGFEPYYLYLAFIGYAILLSCVFLYFAHKTAGLSVPQYLSGVVLKSITVLFILIGLSLLPQLFMAQGLWRTLTVVCINSVATVFIVYFVGFDSSERMQINKIADIVKSKIKRPKAVNQA